MKESDLYPPVRDWLKARGYTVYVEIFDCDVVGINAEGHMVAVELKVGMLRDLPGQLMTRCTWADEVWAAVPHTADKPFSSWSYYGWGLLIIRNGKLSERRKARPQPWNWHKRRNYIRGRLSYTPPARDSDLAGLPACRALREQRLAAMEVTNNSPSGRE